MRRVLLFIAAAAVAVAVAWWLSGLTGEVTGNVSGVQFSTPTPVFITLLAAVVILVHLLLRLLGGIFHSHRRIGSWRTDRRRDAGDVAVHRTLVALARRGGDARREAERAGACSATRRRPCCWPPRRGGSPRRTPSRSRSTGRCRPSDGRLPGPARPVPAGGREGGLGRATEIARRAERRIRAAPGSAPSARSSPSARATGPRRWR